MTAEDRLESALRSPEPGRALRGQDQELAREGMDKTALYELLEAFLLRLRCRPDHREAGEEAVLDVLDALTGWCHPSAELLPDERAR